MSRRRIRSRSLAAAAGAGLLLLAGCASTAQGPVPSLPSCFYFSQDSVFQALRLPWGVRLEEETLTAWPAMAERGARKAVTLTGTEERDHPFGYWIATSEDSVEIGYPAGGGLLLELGVRDDHGFSGTATPVGDAITPGAPAPAPRPVDLVWARCP